jgi:hypothetical protein
MESKEDLKWYKEYRIKVLGITQNQQGFLAPKKKKKLTNKKKSFKVKG